MTCTDSIKINRPGTLIRRVANNRRVWKKYIIPINEGSGTNEGPRIFVTLHKQAFENSHFFRFSPNSIIFQKYFVVHERSAVKNSFRTYVCYAPDVLFLTVLYGNRTFIFL